MRQLIDLSILALKQLYRYPLRSGLTVVGVATGMFLFTTVETVQHAMREATEQRAEDNVLVVYRENRFCPFTSRLPEHYGDQIAQVPGVRAAVPMKVLVNNCNTSLDVVTFRGLPLESYDAWLAEDIDIVAGGVEAWRQRSDAALIGEVLARRRGLSVGDQFDAAGVTVSVAGIIASDEPQNRDVAYVQLPFLQQSSRGGLGEVTQFLVTVDDPNELESVAQAIDDTFTTDIEPTHTRPQQAFITQTAGDMIELVGFTRWVGLGAVAAVVALVANTVLLAVRSRVREHAVLATLGFSDYHIAWLVLLDGLLLAVLGGIVGAGGAWMVLRSGGYSLASEGLSLVFDPTIEVLLSALVVAGILGVIAGALPAWSAARRPILASLRMQ